MRYKVLVGSPIHKKYSCEYLNDILNYNGAKCLIVDYLNPELTILLPSIDLMVVEKGSKIAHLAIVAAEYGKTILLVESISELKKQSKIVVSDNIEFKNEN